MRDIMRAMSLHDPDFILACALLAVVAIAERSTRRGRRGRPAREGRRRRQAGAQGASTAPPKPPASSAGSIRSRATGAPRTATPPRSGASSTSEFVPQGARARRRVRRASSPPWRASAATSSRWAATCGGGVDLDLGPLTSLDRRLAAWSPASHVSDDMFGNKLAFVALLNFPLTTLEERMAEGMGWSRRQWAEARLAQQFQTRVPADVNEKIAQAYSEAEAYIADYNVYMHHLLTADGRRLFPPGLRLITPLEPARRAEGALRRGRRPAEAAHDREGDGADRAPGDPGRGGEQPAARLEPETNAVTASTVKDADAPAGKTAEPRAEREPDERYRQFMGIFKAERLGRSLHPDNPSHIARRFNVNREIPEAQVKALFEALLDSPLGAKVGRLIEKRLGRKLEPFDIWYVGFKPRGKYTEAELDAMTKKQYPTPEAYAADIPRLLRDLGFSAGARAVPGRPHRGRSLARRGPRDGRRPARRQGPPAHARRQGRHGLQGLQHRGPRDGPQRRADLLAADDRPHAAAGRAQHRLHRGARLRVPGATTSSCWA